MKKYVKYDNVEYFMPFFYCNDLFIPILDELLKDEINPVKYVYGCPDCAWQGGRRTYDKVNNLARVDLYLKSLKCRNIIPTFTFNNINNIEDKLNDENTNNLLDIAQENHAHFIVATDALYNHIKSRYPNAKMHCSVINPICKKIDDKDFDETKFYNEMLDKYDVVVIRPEYTIENIDKLDKLISDISRIEVLINQHCLYDCKYHKFDYILINKINNTYFSQNIISKEEIEKIEAMDKEVKRHCPKKQNIEYKSVCMTDEQVAQLIDIGVRKIKLQGRHKKFDELFDELYDHFFNKNISKEEIRNKIDLISARMIQYNKKAALIFALDKKITN